MAMEQIWRKSYGKEIPDLDPNLFETDGVTVINESMDRFKKNTAMIFMGVRITYGEIDAYADRFARMLIKQGFRKGDVVGINLPNIPEYVIAWLGIMRAGCISSGVSPLLSPKELEHQLNDGEIKGLVTLDALFVHRVAPMADRLPHLKLVVGASVAGFLPKIKQILGKLLKKVPSGKLRPLPGKTVMAFSSILKDPEYAAGAFEVELGPNDAAYLMYTGGTTGPSKGAVLTHRNFVSELLLTTHYMEWTGLQVGIMSAFPMFHIAGLMVNAFAIYCGMTQMMLPDPRNVNMIMDFLEKEKPYIFGNVPSIYYMLLAQPRFKTIDHSSLAQCVSAAAPFPVDSQKQLEAVIGQGKLIELYGMTETTGVAVMNPLHGAKRLGAVGLPLPNTDVKIVDTATGEEAPLGEPGEILVRNPMIMQSYFKKPEETRKAVDSEGFMHTGDVGFMDEDGYITLVDRTKDMLIVSGFKVFSKKVEDIMADHPAIEIMALIGAPNPDRPGSELAKAFVTLDAEYAFDGDREALKADIIAFAKEHLAPYEVPKEIEIIEEMPLTSVGKLDKKVLRANVGA
ncbi:AMP-dependent CoA ligase/synthetase [Desulfatibacillum aliphaticivorans]|uniref:AMP-dependent CoA ligase/synthetase n=1 Tax=Desulfatibacillum aliphaticivorans TaxID=218208 RepID=B8FIV7_DESAL|nr:AMP-binding protein [Desulfatibacillum aliphaticivorans]ACL04348.1 AMP-dependent CoA ligase/synthetase [Desulfatibacillum aliphaticivorans]